MRQTFFKTASTRPGRYFYKMSDTGHKHPYIRKTCLVCSKRTMQKTRSKGFCSRGCAKAGDWNPNWHEGSIYKQYTRSQMTKFHKDVYAARGRAFGCDNCGTRENRMYHWANVSNHYSDVWDYKSMCVPCHHLFDRKKRREALPS